MARTAVFLCCTLFAFAVLSSTVAADGSFKATLKGDKLKVTGEKGHVEYEGTFPTKECKKACKETCEKKEVETCVPVVVHKCKNVPKIIKECEDIPVTKIVKKCKNTCDENAAEIKITKKAVDTHVYVSAPKHGRRLFNDPKHIVKKGEACKEVCKDVEEEDVEEECKEKTKMKEECKEVVEEKCETEEKPFCKTECAVTCKPKLGEAVAGAAGLVATAGAADAPKHPGLLGTVAKHLG